MSLPHITVVAISCRDKHEKLFTDNIKEITAQFSPININLDGFGNFGSHTIFAKVYDREGVLEDYIKAIHSLFGLKSSGVFPHLTLASKLPEFIFASAYKDYSEKEFKRSFHCPSVRLLKKISEKDNFKTLEEFPFGH